MCLYSVSRCSEGRSREAGSAGSPKGPPPRIPAHTTSGSLADATTRRARRCALVVEPGRDGSSECIVICEAAQGALAIPIRAVVRHGAAIPIRLGALRSFRTEGRVSDRHRTGGAIIPKCAQDEDRRRRCRWRRWRRPRRRRRRDKRAVGLEVGRWAWLVLEDALCEGGNQKALRR